jgi:hypothetical protein
MVNAYQISHSPDNESLLQMALAFSSVVDDLG